MTAMQGVQVIYEDNHILVVVKPQNMLSQADATGDLDILTVLKAYIKEKYQKPGEVYLGLVHRLDRPAGGLMLFARTSKAAARLADAMRKGEIHKMYLLRCQGCPAPQTGEMIDYLRKGDGNLVQVVKEGAQGAKRAMLRYTVLEPGDKSLCEVELLTGRAHQIRVQFASRGWPLLGDARYGTGGRQLALWAHRLAFMHPVKKERLEFTFLPPKGCI